MGAASSFLAIASRRLWGSSVIHLLVQTQISPQLYDGLPWKFVQTFMTSRRSILMILKMPSSPVLPPWGFKCNASTTTGWIVIHVPLRVNFSDPLNFHLLPSSGFFVQHLDLRPNTSKTYNIILTEIAIWFAISEGITIFTWLFSFSFKNIKIIIITGDMYQT